MAREVSVREVQDAILVIQSWANGFNDFDPDPPAELLRATARLLEQLLVYREET